MRLQEIKKAIEESRREGGIAALEEYDRTRKLPFQKEVVSFTIKRSIMQEFRKKYRRDMSRIVEREIEKVLRKEIIGRAES